ncbi:MAG: KAP family NTPase [Pseudodesulfovibrio sp.]|uniref:KAP P-loop domain protein n=1 Tax=Pseudodesulfovibrio aespoeensis (strain ATCC 700646 / DSM 10631 / Aspo-2) TaxID=643562 RepID=E6VUF3_PSEA9|nr:MULTISPECIES: P-loop NTPase fold protein [Pseudodesulfovibrio]MBU4193110.1 KAP family NTPase [Pseudomonadota bacterium]ADU61098.1 KAP P-loop domain protein [Pseudodesulfovibrio aespoeensis Aspo-2]MBU4244116.1 KAP family NTPase [Pseudomonadota bacterium]MBU4476477.1 KAP family NTPase [Pseudomonadota bacterium]MBU4517471.1 KAP family NTPase [Pseudomonadota bacterium]
MIKRNAELQFSQDDLVVKKDEEKWFDADLLDRGPHIKAVSELLLMTQGNFVMTVSSPWGTGKTTFVRMWKAYLESRGCPCVLFNAWEHDFAENPFLTFVAEMHSQLCTLKSAGKETCDMAFTALKEAAKKLFPRLISLGARGLLGVSLDVEGVLGKDIGKGLCEALGGSLEAYASDVMEKHGDTKRLVEDFKAELSKVVASFSDRPLFFFVDELDRCKPTYSVELLEAVKHLFEVDGVIFILALDREQLGHSVKAAYGEGIDADGYLRRFIDLEYRIPEPSKEAFIRHLSEFYGVSGYPLFKAENAQRACGEFEDEFIKITKNWPLRTIEKAFLRGTILLRGIKPIGWAAAKGFAHYICLRELDHEALSLICGGEESKAVVTLREKELAGSIDIEFIVSWTFAKNNSARYSSVNRTTSFREPRERDEYSLAVRYAQAYREKYGTHLHDEVVKFLELSESLVQQSTEE